MTMHLEKGLTMLRSKAKPKTMTKKQLNQYKQDLCAYNKELKQQGRHSERMTLDEYIDSIYGRTPKYKSKPTVAATVNSAVSSRRETPDYPSHPFLTKDHNTPKIESKKYSGERKLVGIATMHKSNMVPVFEDDKNYAIDLAHMRR
jgi:hypothetical protein